MKTAESTNMFKHYLQAFQGEMGILPVCYATARSLLKGLGAKSNAPASPPDLLYYPANYAGRNPIPRKIVSNVILKFEDLEPPGVYLDKTADSQMIRWMDILHGERGPQTLPSEKKRS
jgi:hypothetical protein